MDISKAPRADGIQRPEACVACLCIPDFPLSLLLRELPDDFRFPVAVVDREDATSTVIFVDARAAKRKIHPGLRYATAVTLCPELHAVAVPPQKIESAHQGIIGVLKSFSPVIEPIATLLGAYYLDLRGMQRLADDLHAWAKQVQDALSEQQSLPASVAIGFTRFGVLTAARSSRSITVFSSENEERKVAFETPLKFLAPPTKALAELDKLGVRTVRDLRRIPEQEIRSRFNEQFYTLAKQSRARDGVVHGIRFFEPFAACVEFDYSRDNVEQLVAAFRHLCGRMLKKMKIRELGVSEIYIHMKMELGDSCHETLKTAAPTLDVERIVKLVHLRFSALNLEHGVTALAVRLMPSALPDGQQVLDPKLAQNLRELDAADQALAQVASEFGAEHLLMAQCQDSHLPGESFRWEPFGRMRKPAPPTPIRTSVIRRIRDRPKRISTPRRIQFERVLGPYTVSGLWWRDKPVHHHYYFLETPSGATYWVLYDRLGRQWYEQGCVQ